MCELEVGSEHSPNGPLYKSEAMSPMKRELGNFAFSIESRSKIEFFNIFVSVIVTTESTPIVNQSNPMVSSRKLHSLNRHRLDVLED